MGITTRNLDMLSEPSVGDAQHFRAYIRTIAVGWLCNCSEKNSTKS